MTAQPQRPAFGTLLTSHMAVAAYSQGRWSKGEIQPVAPIELSPAAHVLHYASTCFEGFKAYRRADGSVHTFRMDRHIQRLQQSARQLVLPEPAAAQVADMVRAVVKRSLESDDRALHSKVYGDPWKSSKDGKQIVDPNSKWMRK